MKNMSLLAFTFIATISPIAPVLAGTVTGQVGDILFTDGPAGTNAEALTYVYIVGTAAGKPACATVSYWMIRDAKSDGGKYQIAALMTAKASGRNVTISGTGTCTRWSDGEDIKTVVLK